MDYGKLLLFHSHSLEGAAIGLMNASRQSADARREI